MSDIAVREHTATRFNARLTEALLDVDFGIFFFAEIIKVLAHALVEGLRAANYARFQNRVFRLYFLTALFDHLLRVARRVAHLPTREREASPIYPNWIEDADMKEVQAR